MKNIHQLILGVTAAASLVAFMGDAAYAGGASKEKVIEQSTYTVGTRRVGMVGSKPYPLVVSQTDSHVVKTSKHRDVDITSETSSTTTVSNTEPYEYTAKGGTYYTSVGDNFYPDGDLNIHVVDIGSFND